MVLRRLLILTVALLVGNTPAFACDFGEPNYRNCIYREMLRNTGADDTRPVTSRRNPFGGFDFSDGTTCQRNPFGGLDCHR